MPDSRPSIAELSSLVEKLASLLPAEDARAPEEFSPEEAGELLRGRPLRDLSGMSLNELAAEVDRYYLADPRRRELPPAAVLFRILAAQRDQKEMSPLPGPEPRP